MHTSRLRHTCSPAGVAGPALLPALLFVLASPTTTTRAEELQRLKYHDPSLVVDLGVGLWAWPLPMDYDRDGDLDLVVVCPDKPNHATYFFENPGGDPKFPVFRPGKRIGDSLQNSQCSQLPGGEFAVLTPGRLHADFRADCLAKGLKLPVATNFHAGKIRANQWKLADLDGDGRLDLVVGIGDWTEYGWDDAYDADGRWTNGPLHGWVYWARNLGSEGERTPETDGSKDSDGAGANAGKSQLATLANAKFAAPEKLTAAGRPVDVFGMPSPCFADFDGDGDLDLLCGEFLDQFTYFENRWQGEGQEGRPRLDLAEGRRLTRGGRPLAMDLEMITPTAVDWDRDGDIDLVVGDEDGRVAWLEHTGELEDGVPQFLPPRYFQQQADEVKFGALATPATYDWDGDGDSDIICGNTAGYIGWIENLGRVEGQRTPRWGAPRYLEAAGEVIRIQAGPNGSIQGPCEAKWGYTTVCVADWNDDGLPDIVANSIWGKVHWYRNVGERGQPRLAAAQPIEVAWTGPPPKPQWTWWTPEGRELATQWRTTPMVVDFDGDQTRDLVMLDHEGYLCLFRGRRVGDALVLDPPRRALVDESGAPLHWNEKRAGGSGRRKIWAVDWDGDGRLDLLANSQNADLWRGLAPRDGAYPFQPQGTLDTRVLAGHTTSPTVIDLDGDGRPELLVGGEDGFLYHKFRAPE